MVISTDMPLLDRKKNPERPEIALLDLGSS
jgi:hypothetical protein